MEHWSLAGSLHSALPPLTPPLLTRPPPFPCPHRLQVWHVPRSSRASWMSSLRTIVDINTNLSSKFWVGGGRETRWGRDTATRPRQWLRTSAMPPLFKLHVPDPPASHCLPLPLLQASLNAYSDLSPSEFAQAILMTPTTPKTPAQGKTAAVGNKTTTASTTNKTTAATTTTTTTKARARRLMANCWNCTPAPAYPAAISWLAAGKVLPATGFQAECASSWAFATAAALESSLLIAAATNTTAPLSAQHIMVRRRQCLPACLPACVLTSCNPPAPTWPHALHHLAAFHLPHRTAPPLSSTTLPPPACAAHPPTPSILPPPLA